MTEAAPDEPTLDDVMSTQEQAVPDHRAHGKTDKHLNDDLLAERTEEERVEAGVDDFDPDEVPSAED